MTLTTFRECQRVLLDPDCSTEDYTEAIADMWEWPPDAFPEADPGGAPKRLAIVGKATSWVMAPWGEPGVEIWGMNEKSRNQPLSAFTRWFQLHNPEYLERFWPPGIEDLSETWSTERDMPVYMDKHYPEYPDSVSYPKIEVEALTSHGGYHASSFDWMLALGILEGFERIDLYGIDLRSWQLTGEPVSARACLEYWIGVAEGRGIEVEIYGRSDVLKIVHIAKYVSDLQYGFDCEPGLLLAEHTQWRDLR